MALKYVENPSKVVLLSAKSSAYLARIPGYLSVSVMDNLGIKRYLDVRVQFKALPKTKYCLEKHFVHLRSHYILDPVKKDDLKHYVSFIAYEFCHDYGINVVDNLDVRRPCRYNDTLWNTLHEKGY